MRIKKNDFHINGFPLLNLTLKQWLKELGNGLYKRTLASSCGHTTDFYLGKTDLPRANSSKICLGKFISGFVLPR